MKDDDAHKFYFHPYYGFIPVSKLTDEKMRVGVNMEMKYVLHPYFGFVPESQKIEQVRKNSLSFVNDGRTDTLASVFRRV
jgi:hypothetical protein